MEGLGDGSDLTESGVIVSLPVSRWTELCTSGSVSSFTQVSSSFCSRFQTPRDADTIFRKKVASVGRQEMTYVFSPPGMCWGGALLARWQNPKFPKTSRFNQFLRSKLFTENEICSPQRTLTYCQRISLPPGPAWLKEVAQGQISLSNLPLGSHQRFA